MSTVYLQPNVYPMDLFLLKLMINAMTFNIVNFPFLDGDVPRRASFHGVYISQLIRFVRVCNYVGLKRTKYVFNCQTSPAGLSVS